MENASKALLIAGAVLIAIVLISLGVALVRQGKGVTDSGATTANQLKTSAGEGANAVSNSLNGLFSNTVKNNVE